MPPSKTPQGQPIRYVPRRPQAPFPGSPHPERTTDRLMEAVTGLPMLPPEAVTPEDAIEVVNAIRQLLIDGGWAREE